MKFGQQGLRAFQVSWLVSSILLPQMLLSLPAPTEVSSLILNDLFLFIFFSKKVKSVCFLIKPLYSWQALKKGPTSAI